VEGKESDLSRRQSELDVAEAEARVRIQALNDKAKELEARAEAADRETAELQRRMEAVEREEGAVRARSKEVADRGSQLDRELSIREVCESSTRHVTGLSYRSVV
jgi:uncharacterized protein (DUF3084 family)